MSFGHFSSQLINYYMDQILMENRYAEFFFVITCKLELVPCILSVLNLPCNCTLKGHAIRSHNTATIWMVNAGWDVILFANK